MDAEFGNRCYPGMDYDIYYSMGYDTKRPTLPSSLVEQQSSKTSTVYHNYYHTRYSNCSPTGSTGPFSNQPTIVQQTTTQRLSSYSHSPKQCYSNSYVVAPKACESRAKKVFRIAIQIGLLAVGVGGIICKIKNASNLITGSVIGVGVALTVIAISLYVSDRYRAQHS